jgi:hypothetical protein
MTNKCKASHAPDKRKLGPTKSNRWYFWKFLMLALLLVSKLRREYYFTDSTNRKKDSFWLPTVVEKSPIAMATLRKGILMSITP